MYEKEHAKVFFIAGTSNKSKSLKEHSVMTETMSRAEFERASGPSSRQHIKTLFMEDASKLEGGVYGP